MDTLFPQNSVSQHQVLARKWRPRRFASLVGQDHVVRALRHGIKTGRIHHAYLLTGTRGVGKTTIARILAKALNCEHLDPQEADPCGQCASCVQIDHGRYVDYIELDAASHRSVEEMAQLLENAIYAPTIGRWKVYVIDEVHMLSTHAFNAMLKTLEEPPGHVVFVLATTDPQKVPVTVLSRCLQLALRNMSATAIAAHLAMVLEEEKITFEADALTLIGKSAAGSMRDALSLLDQAISHGAGEIRSAQVMSMLGAVDRDQVAHIMDALLEGSPRKLCSLAEEICALGIDAAEVLQELAQLVQALSLIKQDAIEQSDPQLLHWADQCEPEQLQVYWQILLHGRRDLPLAPDPSSGLTMTLLRLHAFRPLDGGPSSAPIHGAQAKNPAKAQAPTPAKAQAPTPALARPTNNALSLELDCAWSDLATRVPCSGFARQFLEQSELIAIEGMHIRVRVPIRPLAEAATVNKVKELLVAYFRQPVRLSAEVGAVGIQTAASIQDAQRRNELDAAIEDLRTDPFVQAMISELGAQIDPDSVRPRKH